MDIDPGPECRVLAAIELTMGNADMRIVQTGANGLEELDHLWRRPPFALERGRGGDERAALDQLRALLNGFARAARDYGADSAYLLIDGLDAWREDIARIAAELGLRAIEPEPRRRADLALAAASRALGGPKEHMLLVAPGGAETCVASGDGSCSCWLPLGLDGGYIDDMLLHALRGERRRLGRKGGVDARQLLRDAACAGARCLRPEGMEEYRLCLSVSLPRGILAPGTYTARQLDKITQDMARRAADAGALPCYAVTEQDADAESYRAACLRRAHNALCLAGAVRARLCKDEVSIVASSELDEALWALGREDERLDEAGCDAVMARGGAMGYAGAHGGSSTQSARVATAARMMLRALSPAFDADELATAEELIALAAALGDCAVEDAELERAVERLPGLNARARERLSRICLSLRSANNDAICASLMPEAGPAAGDEEMFPPDQAAGDEFSPTDEYEYEGTGADEESAPPEADEEGAASEAEGRQEQYVRARLARGGHAGAALELRVAAILALARALNAGGGERLQELSAKLGGRGLILRASPRESAVLETLEFKYRAELFERAFGIKARLKLDKRHPGAARPARA